MIKNDIINFDKGLVSDGFKKEQVWRGKVGRVLLGEAVSANDLLYPVLTSLGTVKEWKQANANSAATMPALALALEDGTDAQRIRVLFSGYRKDIDFDYGTLATGTITLSGTVVEGDKIILGDILNPYCLMFTATAGTTALTKIAATATLSTTGIGVNAETFTIGGVVFECSTDGVIESTSDYMVDLQVSTAQGALETAIEEALDQAIADKALDISYVAFTGNDCVITLGGTDDSYVGLEQNLVSSLTGTMSNATFAATTFLGGVPAVNFEMAGTLTIAAAKVLLTAGIVSAIAAGLDISQAAWATNDLVLTAGTTSHKGYKGNNLQMAEVDAAGTLDAGSNLAVGATAFAGGVEGGILYASESKGLMTLTRPTTIAANVQVVGFALEADKFFFNPQPLEAIHPSITMPTPGAGCTNTGSTNTAKQWVDKESGELITELLVDITDLKGAGNAARDAIGTAAPSYLFQYTVAAFGYVHTVEMTCLELPAGCGTTVDIDLEAEYTADKQLDGACSDEVLCASGGWAVGKKVSTAVDVVADRYIYFTEGDTNGDGTVFTAGQFKIRLIGTVPAAF